MKKHDCVALRVLLVDDYPDMCASIEMLLRTWGHDVRTAGDGPAGLSAAKDYLPHVVLLDVGLPGMDGYEVARRLCAYPPVEPRPRLVTMSGHGLKEDFLQSRLSGCDRHLVKPIDLLELQLMLAQYAELIRRPQRQEVGIP